MPFKPRGLQDARSVSATRNLGYIANLPRRIPTSVCCRRHLHIFGNNLEAPMLAAIRDALLPKPLSGEMRVKETETLVEATV